MLREILLPELLAAALTQLTVMGEQSPATSPVSSGEPSSTHCGANTAFCPAGVLAGYQEWCSSAEGHTSQHGTCLLLQEEKHQDRVWALVDARDVGLPLLGRCVAAAALWILAGQGGSEVRALTNTPPFEGSQCITLRPVC